MRVQSVIAHAEGSRIHRRHQPRQARQPLQSRGSQLDQTHTARREDRTFRHARSQGDGVFDRMHRPRDAIGQGAAIGRQGVRGRRTIALGHRRLEKVTPCGRDADRRSIPIAAVNLGGETSIAHPHYIRKQINRI